MHNGSIRIILVDDHQLVRQSMGLMLGTDKRFTIIKECDNGHDAILHAGEMQPDVMLVDINMHPVNGFEVVKQVLAKNPSIRIIAISVNNHISYVNKMLSLGASGYITKGSPFDEITQAIIQVHGGEKYLSNDIKNLI
jgi:two-component system, NarL family, invasion response regulator UvrY